MGEKVLGYILQPLNLIDAVAIFPYYFQVRRLAPTGSTDHPPISPSSPFERSPPCPSTLSLMPPSKASHGPESSCFVVCVQILIEDAHVNLGFLRLVRLARVFRVLKMARYSETSHLVTFTLRKSVPALLLLVLFLFILTTVFGSLVYYFESGTFKVTTEVSSTNTL